VVVVAGSLVVVVRLIVGVGAGGAVVVVLAGTVVVVGAGGAVVVVVTGTVVVTSVDVVVSANAVVTEPRETSRVAAADAIIRRVLRAVVTIVIHLHLTGLLHRCPLLKGTEQILSAPGPS
jgi:hypothetical protein